MNVEIGTETPIFLFWEYLFQKFRYFVFVVQRCCMGGGGARSAPLGVLISPKIRVRAAHARLKPTSYSEVFFSGLVVGPLRYIYQFKMAEETRVEPDDRA